LSEGKLGRHSLLLKFKKARDLALRMVRDLLPIPAAASVAP